MSEKILWNSVKIQVPSDFITVSKTGQIRIKPPLTKKNRISTSNKKPAIELIPADVNEVSIIDQGKKEISETKLFKKKWKEDFEAKKKTIKKDWQIKTQENKDMGNEDINRAGSRFVKGSDEAKAFMQKMREKRIKKN